MHVTHRHVFRQDSHIYKINLKKRENNQKDSLQKCNNGSKLSLYLIVSSNDKKRNANYSNLIIMYVSV